MERSALLAREQLIAGQQLDEAQIAAKTARGELARTAASLDKSVIRAPFAGTVGLREVSVGAFVSPGTAITHITNTKAIKLVFSVPEGNIPDVAIGQTAYGVVGSCRYKFTGRVTVLDPMVDPVTRSIRVQASVANEEGELKPGMSARIRLELTKIPNALVIPEEAVIREGTMSRVFVVQGGKAVPRPIVVGEIRTGMVEIQSGLKPGDVVITTGHQKVRPGARVIPQPHESVKNPNLDLGKADAGVECWF
jgi:membrane fusion protein (multidrug efflux system)